MTRFMNKTDYDHHFLQTGGGMGGEHVVKVGEDQYWGFGFGNDSIKSFSGWKKTLLDSYNTLAKRDKISLAKPSDIPGYNGRRTRFNYFIIAQELFELRNK